MPDAHLPITKERKRILIVDDKVSDTRLVKLYLEQTNEYTVREENAAKQALTTAHEFRPNLILLDVRMPGLDGGELAACFKEDPKLKTVPIVFLTSLVTKSEVTQNGGRSGRFPILAKPIVLPELLACLREHAGG